MSRKKRPMQPAVPPALRRRRFLLPLLVLASAAVICICAARWEKQASSPSPTLAAVHPAPAAPACCTPGEENIPHLPDPETARVSDAGTIEPTVIEKVPPPSKAPEGMVWIPPGHFAMGSPYEPFEDARPIHTVTLDGFWMDATPVTNAQYAQFVQATGYKTVAERKPHPKDLPGVPLDRLAAGSLVFHSPSQAVPLDDVSRWWDFIPGADWQHPEGPGSDLKGRDNHPVVQVCNEDAEAYAKWAGKRLPTEAEWEYAARGGLTQMPYVWGKEFHPGGKWMANTWQGRFPSSNSKEDGYERTSPVRTFPPNGFGLYDMAGNVWEWCSDWYRPDAYAHSPRKNPQGPSDSFDPDEPGLPKRVQRGGSFLCTDQYCSRYMPGGRGKGAIDTGASHIGFRCVRSLPDESARRLGGYVTDRRPIQLTEVWPIIPFPPGKSPSELDAEAQKFGHWIAHSPL